MNINQFAVYQLKLDAETRKLQYRSYSDLQKEGIQVRYEHYEQVYIGRMQPEDTPEMIRNRLKRKLPNNFHGHAISVSDVLVLNNRGEVTAYYVEKHGFTVIAGFIRKGSSGALLSFETTDYHIEGKAGSWLAYDSIIIDGKEFFLMEHMEYGRNAAYVILDEAGTVVEDNNKKGFDEAAKQKIREYLQPVEPVPEIQQNQKPPLENWQKYMENGEYLRSAEISEEQNYNLIDGRHNNTAPKKEKGRASVLAKLRRKQAEIAKRSGKSIPQMEVSEDMERRRK